MKQDCYTAKIPADDGPPALYRAARAELAPVIKTVNVHGWGWLVRCQGTQEQLVRAEVARPDMFRFGKSGTRHTHDEHGNSVHITRRAKERFDLELWISDAGHMHDPSNKKTALRDRWVAAGEAVSETLARIREASH